MNRNAYTILVLCIAITGCLCLIPPATATSELHIVRYASDQTTVISEKTVTWQWLRDNLPVQGDGTTHYYHQGPVFVSNADPALQEELRWNDAEDTNVQEKDYGAVKGTNLKDICNLVGGLSSGEEVTLKATDGLTKKFAYRNVYDYTSRQGPMVITWERDGSNPAGGYDEAMKLVFFADTSANPWGIHAFGNNDWHESADSKYWYYYYQGSSDKYPTTTGLSVKYISDVIIYSSVPASEVQPAAAAFSATPLTGPAPLTVQFTDESDNSPTSWEWDFNGDGSADSTEQNPSFTYAAAGTYTVTLTSANAYGDTSETKDGYITVSAATAAVPVAIISADHSSGTVPLTVQFTDHSTGSPTSWEWDFNDDGSVDSTAQNPSFTFTDPGTYTVSLSCGNSAGATAQNSTTIEAGGDEPVARFSADVTSGPSPLTVRFTDTSTGTGITEWEWDFDDNGVIDSHDQNPRHTFTEPGTYPVRLKISGSLGTDTVLKNQYIRVTGTESGSAAETATAAPVTSHVTTTAVTTSASQKQATPAKAFTAPVTSLPPVTDTTAESPGPDAALIVITLALFGLGSMQGKK